MKILYLTPDIPNPPYTGTPLRCFNVVRLLSARHEVFLLGLNRTQDSDRIAEVSQFCVKVRAVAPDYPPRYQRPWFKPLRSVHWRLHELRRKPDTFLSADAREFPHLIRQTIQEWQPDIVQIETTPMGQFLLRAPSMNESVSVLTMNDVISEVERQKIGFARTRAERVKCWLDWRKSLSLERRICHAADVCLTVSESDRQMVRRLYGREDVIVSPSGLDVQAYRPAYSADGANPEILFTGLMVSMPNHDAVLWFCREILPLIQREVPSAHFTIMGRHPRPEVIALASEHVTVTGEVPDAQPYFQRAAVCVVPLRMGSGLRVKIQEALAMGKAVVSTALGAEGLEVVPGQHLLIANDSSSFAQAVVHLLKDADLRTRLGKAGRELVERRYDWRPIVDELERIYEDALSQENRNRPRSLSETSFRQPLRLTITRTTTRTTTIP